VTRIGQAACDNVGSDLDAGHLFVRFEGFSKARNRALSVACETGMLGLWITFSFQKKYNVYPLRQGMICSSDGVPL
jgi:hypothetical protein